VNSGSLYLEQLLKSSSQAIVICRSGKQIIKVNRAFGKLFDLSEDYCEGQDFNQLLTPPQFLAESECVFSISTAGTPVSLSTVRITGSGKLIRVFQLALALITEQGDRLICFIFKPVSEDSTQRDSDKLDDSVLLENAFENSMEPSLYSDASGNVVRVNTAFYSEFQWTHMQIEGKSVSDLLIPETIRPEADYINAVLNAGRILRLQTIRKNRNGTTLDVSLICIPLNSQKEYAYRIFRTQFSEARTSADVMAGNVFRNCPFPGPNSGLFFMAEISPQRTIEFTAPGSASFAGYKNVSFISGAFSSIIVEEDLSMVLDAVNESLSRRNSYTTTYRIKDSSGETLWVMEHGRAFPSTGGNAGFCAGCIIDISETKKDRENFLLARTRIEKLHVVAGKLQQCRSEGEVYRICSEAGQSVLNGACSSIFLLDDSRLKQVASSGRETHSCNLECSSSMAELALDSSEPWYFASREMSDTACPAGSSGGCFRLSNKAVFQIVTGDSSALGSIDTRITELLLGYTQQALKRIALQHQLITQALHDPLTGIHNRNYFNRIIELEEIRARRLGSSIGFIMVDIDDFKQVNDRYGHMTGDCVLREVAGILENALRKTDIVLRFGGDEFLIILTRMASDHCHRVEARINTAMEASPQLHMKQGEQIAVSMGHAFWTPDAKESIDEVLGLADNLMYQNKRKKLKKR
jgi:diguanylate cyclase (GGDEF)-like protein/PAS domain S-box-containing protein